MRAPTAVGRDDHLAAAPAVRAGSGTLIDERSALDETRARARPLRLLQQALLCPLLAAAACAGAGARADAGTGGQGGGTSDGDRAGTGGGVGTGGIGMAGEGGVRLDPYGRCDAGPAGAVLNSPQCPVPNSTCNAWWCSPRCPPNVGTGDDCPLPLTGTAERMCGHSLCYLTCLGGRVCPDGMECKSGECRWPAP